MKAVMPILAALIATSACDNSIDQTEDLPHRTEPEASADALLQSNEPTPRYLQNELDYREARRCSVLVNIIEILVDSEIITERAIVDNVDQVSAAWHERARTLGGQLGKTSGEVQLDIDKAQLEKLAPLKTLSQPMAAARIQEYVREAGTCED